MMQVLAQTSVLNLKGVGAALAEKLERLGLRTVQDLLFHLPRDYEDRSRLTPLDRLEVGRSVLVEGIVHSCEEVRGRRPSLAVRLTEGNRGLTLRFYHFYPQQKAHFPAGQRLRVFGEVRLGSSGVEMYHPEYKITRAGEPLPGVRVTLVTMMPCTPTPASARP